MHDHGLEAILSLAAHVLQRPQARFRCHVIENRRAAQFAKRVANQPGQCVIAVRDDAVTMQHDGLGGDGSELAHALFAVAYLLCRQMVVADIGHQRHNALEYAFFLMRAQHCLDVLQPASLVFDLAGVAQRLSVVDGHGVQIRFDLCPDQLAHNVTHIHAHYGLHGVAKVLCIARVGKTTGACVGIKISQHSGRCIGHQSKNGVLIPRLLCYQRIRHAPPFFLGVFI